MYYAADRFYKKRENMITNESKVATNIEWISNSIKTSLDNIKDENHVKYNLKHALAIIELLKDNIQQLINSK